jgi:hypothetical protein
VLDARELIDVHATPSNPAPAHAAVQNVKPVPSHPAHTAAPTMIAVGGATPKGVRPGTPPNFYTPADAQITSHVEQNTTTVNIGEYTSTHQAPPVDTSQLNDVIAAIDEYTPTPTRPTQQQHRVIVAVRPSREQPVNQERVSATAQFAIPAAQPLVTVAPLVNEE